MQVSDELNKWMRNLTANEKRFIKLQGKIRSGSDSQLLNLFDYLNKSGESKRLPAKASFARNLPTLTVRLRALMLDSLYLLHKDDNIESQLSSMLSEIVLLQSKNLAQAAARQVKRAKKLAYDYCRYSYVLLFIENELAAAQILPVDQFAERLRELHTEQLQVLGKLQRLNELHHLHHQLLLMARQFPFSLDPDLRKQVRTLAAMPVVKEAYESESFLEQALAVNILGIRDLFDRDPDSAVPRYQQLIRKWQEMPGWQIDQPQLLITVSKYYQIVCIFSPVDHERIRRDLDFLNGFSGLPDAMRISLQDLLYSNQFATALNTGKFEVVSPMIAEIEAWMLKEDEHLSESQLLPYRCNFLVAEFMAGNLAAANRQVNQILNLHSRKDRLDIYEFALIMRIVLQFELKDDSLNEYILRAGKRHFKKNRIAAEFELLILKHLALLHETDSPKTRKDIFSKLRDALQDFTSRLPQTIPLLGLNEISMWAESHETGVPLKTIFLQRVEENLRWLEGQKKVG